jgi:2'-5' RNA ligase
VRLFAAVEVPASVRDAVSSAIGPLREHHPGLRWTRSDAWHLTLVFLGEVTGEVGARVASAAADVAGEVPSPIGLRLAAPGRFGRRVLWLGIDDRPPGALARLAQRLQAAAVDAGVEVDRRQLHPHLTLARSRGREAAVTRALAAACPTVAGSWSADRVVVYRSHLDAGPARYEELASLPFGPGTAA